MFNKCDVASQGCYTRIYSSTCYRQEETIDASLLGDSTVGTWSEVLRMRSEYAPEEKTSGPTCLLPRLFVNLPLGLYCSL
jgi:hypothetical protein